MTEQTEFETGSLQVAAYLIFKGNLLKGLNREGKQVKFVFEDNGNIDYLVNEYFDNSNELKFWESIRTLKSRIYES